MPLYEYECRQCHRRTEKIQKFSDPELTVCPHCGGELFRTLTAPAIQFKGGGWYKDLYSSAKAPAASSPGTEGAAPKAEKSDAGNSAATAAPAPSTPAPTAGTSGSSTT